MKIIKKIVEGMKFFIQLLKTNKLTRLLTGFFLVVICMKLSETWSFFDYLTILFAIYPIWLTFWLLIYAWVINPIRDGFPNSKFSKKVIPFIDKMVDW
jgi:hypothetical protein